MAIKNNDGTPYKLDTPNPIMASQNLWDRKEYVKLHNKFGKKVTVNKDLLVIKEKKAEYVDGNEIIDIWCSPAYIETTKDELYGTVHSKVKYGPKFIFKGVIKAEDINIEIICVDDVPEESIVFPRNKDKKWWRILKKEKIENENYMLSGILSDFQPSFG